MTVTNARWGDPNHKTILASIDGLEGGIPASPENRHYAELRASGAAIAPYVASLAEVPETISDRQFFQQLAAQGVITPAEALAAVKTGAIPATLQSFIDTLPTEQKFAAEMLVSGAVAFSRRHPMTAALGAGLGWTAEQIDALWRAAAAL